MTALYTISEGAYIGITDNVRQRWRQHCQRARAGTRTKLYAAMRKHPEYRIRVLAHLPRALALAAERAMILGLQPRLNMTAGGDCAPSKDPQVRAKIAAKAVGRKHTPEACAKIKAARALQTNVKAPAFTPEHRAKLSSARIGKKQSAETHAKRAASLKRAYAEGRKQPVRGMPRGADGRVLPKSQWPEGYVLNGNQ